MDIIFFGTPYFAAAQLRSLIEAGIQPKAVVTQPDRPKGRALKLSPPPVKELLLQIAPTVPILQTKTVKDQGFLERLKEFGADLYVVVAYGQILPQKLLNIPSLGCINVHASLLPKYRGAAPIQRVLMNGDKETGVAIQKMVLKMDAGDVIAVAKTEISDDMTHGELEERLIEVSKPLLLGVIKDYEKRIPVAKPQIHTEATYAPKIEIEECQINWGLKASKVHNLIRALSPKPGAWCWILSNGKKKRLKIFNSKTCLEEGKPGELLPGGKVACVQDAVQLIEVQPEGKKKMGAADWLRGESSISFVL